MTRIRHYSLIAVISCLLSLATHAVEPNSVYAADGGHAGTGGELANIQLKLVRELVLASLRKVIQNTETGFQDAESKERKNQAIKDLSQNCVSLGMVTEEVRDACVDFIINTAKDMLKCAEGPNRANLWAIDPVTEAEKKLFVIPYPTTTGFKDVSAHTRAGCEATKNPSDNDIYFYSERILNIPTRYLFTLIAHELGHKVHYRSKVNGEYQSKIIGDDTVIGGEKDGVLGFDFLDRVGYALLIYGGSKPSAFDSTLVPEPAVIHDFFACQIMYAGYEPVPFYFFTESKDLLNSYNSTNSEMVGFGYDLTALTKEFLPGEELYIKANLQRHGSCDKGNRANATTIFLIKKIGEEDGHTVDDFLKTFNVLCYPTIPLFDLEYNGMRIECRYDGRQYF